MYSVPYITRISLATKHSSDVQQGTCPTFSQELGTHHIVVFKYWPKMFAANKLEKKAEFLW